MVRELDFMAIIETHGIPWIIKCHFPNIIEKTQNTSLQSVSQEEKEGLTSILFIAPFSWWEIGRAALEYVLVKLSQ